VAFPAAAHALALLTTAQQRGHGEQDYASIVEAVEALSERRLGQRGGPPGA
jgi:hypothetical protein